ncbi:hypothetical protein O3U67_15835 [Brevundimonas diminuta]|uniref:hypothetical protein n=1 Tax=Brevundimonas diminuta TaxID=293 RepID=UPI0022AF314B|nr:hypothetical protein [Brevundimonas diminuta]MCZ4109561.1 hypothetical protein [Brevundimonas diminuta]
MTARFSMVGRDQRGRPIIAQHGDNADYNPFAFHPGGRWERILTGCVLEGRALNKAEIAPFSKSRRRDHGDAVERQKLKRALRGLVRAGLLLKTSSGDEASWAASHVGVAAVHSFGEAA